MPCRQCTARGRRRIAACATSASESLPCPPRREAMRSIKWAAHGASTFTHSAEGGVGAPPGRAVAHGLAASPELSGRDACARTPAASANGKNPYGWARGTASPVTRGELPIHGGRAACAWGSNPRSPPPGGEQHGERMHTRQEFQASRATRAGAQPKPPNRALARATWVYAVASVVA